MNSNQIIIGVTPSTKLIFDEEFPELTQVPIAPYNIRYSKYLPLWLKLLIDVPRLVKILNKEKAMLLKYIKQYHITTVISDNRFGLYNASTHNIYVTHQLNIKAGFLSKMATYVHQKIMNHFDEIWVPDFEEKEKSLAGELAQNSKFKNIKYLGALSRLPFGESTTYYFDYLCLLSGPEPLRTQLEELFINKANKSNKKIAFVRGNTNPLSVKVNPNISVFDMPNSNILSELIIGSKKIICRSGYSTLMDLYCMKKANCILIPTPGQFEQQYLVEYWKQKFDTKVLAESELKSFTFQ